MQNSQANRILERLKQGGRVPMPELSRCGAANPDGWCNSFTRRISELRERGHTIICHDTVVNKQRHTSYELIA
jgi:hypothetical protein